MKNKILVGIVLIIVILFQIEVFAKYDIEEIYKIASIQIDRTRPQLKVMFSSYELTEGSVIVTITANEEIQELEGFCLSEDKKSLTKEYFKNEGQILTIKDLAGNESTAIVTVNRIDKLKPYIEIEDQNNNINYASTNQSLKFKIIIKDDNIVKNTLKMKDVKVFLDEQEITPARSLGIETQKRAEHIYEFSITRTNKKGRLILKIPSGIITDEYGHVNEEVIYDTGIQII